MLAMTTKITVKTGNIKSEKNYKPRNVLSKKESLRLEREETISSRKI